MDCRIALGGAQAIAMGKAWLPDVIIMDISMPDLNGFEATLALRRDLRTGNIVILAFIALDEADVLRHLTHQTFDGYCQKGQSPAALIALIEHLRARPSRRPNKLDILFEYQTGHRPDAMGLLGRYYIHS